MLVGEVDPRSRMQRSSAVSQRRDNSPRPLERRVSFGEPCAGTVSGPDEPRKSFMKFCETDDILTFLTPVLLSASASQRFTNRSYLSLLSLSVLSFRWISTLPFRYAPSSIEMRWVAMSPVTIADLRNSTRSLARMLPSSLPCTTTPLASTLALTCPFGPTVKLLPLRAMLPST